MIELGWQTNQMNATLIDSTICYLYLSRAFPFQHSVEAPCTDSGRKPCTVPFPGLAPINYLIFFGAQRQIALFGGRVGKKRQDGMQAGPRRKVVDFS